MRGHDEHGNGDFRKAPRVPDARSPRHAQREVSPLVAPAARGDRQPFEKRRAAPLAGRLPEDQAGSTMSGAPRVSAWPRWNARRHSHTGSPSFRATSAPRCNCTGVASHGTRHQPAGRHRCVSSLRSSPPIGDGSTSLTETTGRLPIVSHIATANQTTSRRPGPDQGWTGLG